MRRFIHEVLYFLIIGLVLTVGCSNSKAPTDPGDHFRTPTAFDEPSWPIWQSQAIGTKYQNVDLSLCCPVKVLSEKVGLRLILSPPAVSLGWVSAFWWS